MEKIMNLESRLEKAIPPHIYQRPPYKTASVLFKELKSRLGISDEDARDNLLTLNANENPYPPILDKHDDLKSGLNLYPPLQDVQLIKIFSRLFPIAPETILLCDGVDAGIGWLVRALCEPFKDTILICPPTFPKYRTVAELHQVKVASIPLSRNDGRLGLDIDGILNVLDVSYQEQQPIKILFITTPNNPCGHAEDEDRLSEMLGRIEQNYPLTFVVLDRAYWGFYQTPASIPSAIEYPFLIQTFTVSKLYSLAGIRLGALSMHPKLIDFVIKLAPTDPISEATKKVALEALLPDKIQLYSARAQEIMIEREEFISKLKQLSFIQDILHSDANFIAFKIKDSTDFMKHLIENGILLRDVSHLIGEGYVRITLSTPENNKKILKIFDSYVAPQ